MTFNSLWQRLSPNQRGSLLIAGLMLLTACVYIPALFGGYIFDDAYYFVDNTDVHMTSLDLRSLTRAALSQAGANQFRAIGMLTFAINYYFSGLDPFWVKLTNVVIHLSNGLLLFFLLRQLFTLRKIIGGGAPDTLAKHETAAAAAVLAGIWMLLPINFTAVAYVSQRLEALANIFVFGGLIAYLHARQREYQGRRSLVRLLGSLGVFTLLGLLTKESAVTLPLYTVCIELTVTGFRNRDGKLSSATLLTHTVFLLAPLIVGLTWIAHWDFASVKNARAFSITERLMTEPRVLVDYICWTLLPNLDQLSFYHDDLVLSRSLTNPQTTWMAIAALLSLFGIAIWQRIRRPLLCIGILWFFAGHVLTATIIPLELVFEHRNYFASVGVLLAVASPIALEPVVSRVNIRTALATCFIVFISFTTLLRAQEWSHPLRLALSEAEKRPDSIRAQYELARSLIVVGVKDAGSPLLREARIILERSAFKPNAGIAGLQALIYLDCKTRGAVEPKLWQTLTDDLREQPPSQQDIGALHFLLHAQLRGDCPVQRQELLNAFTAALARSDGEVNLVSAYADFAYLELGDPQLAERMFRYVVQSRPTVPVYRENLIKFLIVMRRFDEARHEIDALGALNRYGSLDNDIAQLRKAATDAQPQQLPNTNDTQLPANGAKP